MKKNIIYSLAAFIAVLLIHFTYTVAHAENISNKWAYTEQYSFSSVYFEQQDYFLGISYALSVALVTYALVKFKQNRKHGVKGLIGGITVTGILYTGSCFLLGCCGSPMLPIYLSLFGSNFLGFTKPLTLILTALSVAAGFVIVERKMKPSNVCCTDCNCAGEITG